MINKTIILILVFFTSRSFSQNILSCDLETFKKQETERIGYNKAAIELEKFYAQFTEWERQTILKGWDGANQMSISYADQLTNTEFKKFGLDVGEWNSHFQKYTEGLIDLSIQKYISINKLLYIDTTSNIESDKNYMGIGRNNYSGSWKYPIAVTVSTGLFFKNQALKNEIRFYVLGYDYETAQIKATFFVSSLNTLDADTAFDHLAWFDNQLFFQTLEEYLVFKFNIVCPLKAIQ